MGDLAKLVLTTDELLRTIVSFHTNDFVEFFVRGRSDLFFIRGVSKYVLDNYIDWRLNDPWSNTPKIELDLNVKLVTKAIYYFLEYESAGCGHDGYCSDAENEEYEPFEFWAIVRVENKPYLLSDFDRQHNGCDYRELAGGVCRSGYCDGTPISFHTCKKKIDI